MRQRARRCGAGIGAIVAMAALLGSPPGASAQDFADSIGLIVQFSGPGGSVVPGGFADVEAPGANVVPLTFFGQAFRYQQVFAASAFPGPLTIDALALRPDGPTGAPLAWHFDEVTIVLSTTAAPVDGLSSSLDANLGPDATTVRSGPFDLSSAFAGPDDGPKVFDVVIPLSTPFAYDPAAGNLLLDITLPPGQAIPEDPVAFDAAFNTPGDFTSRTVQALPVVPEPSGLVLAGLGLAGWAAHVGVGRMRKQGETKQGTTLELV